MQQCQRPRGCQVDIETGLANEVAVSLSLRDVVCNPDRVDWNQLIWHAASEVADVTIESFMDKAMRRTLRTGLASLSDILFKSRDQTRQK
jgi:hypothetical protein